MRLTSEPIKYFHFAIGHNLTLQAQNIKLWLALCVIGSQDLFTAWYRRLLRLLTELYAGQSHELAHLVYHP